jgi:hypothetical protein
MEPDRGLRPPTCGSQYFLCAFSPQLYCLWAAMNLEQAWPDGYWSKYIDYFQGLNLKKWLNGIWKLYAKANYSIQIEGGTSPPVMKIITKPRSWRVPETSEVFYEVVKRKGNVPPALVSSANELCTPRFLMNSSRMNTSISKNARNSVHGLAFWEKLLGDACCVPEPPCKI